MGFGLVPVAHKRKTRLGLSGVWMNKMQNAVIMFGSGRGMRFKLGAVVRTRGVDELMKGRGLDIIQYLCRHADGDWGDLEDEDKAENDKAIIIGRRIFSAYNLARPGSQLWVITEADRSLTTFLLPSEY